MRLKKGLIKIWGDLAKKKNKTKQSIKQAQKKKKQTVYVHEGSQY